MILNVPYNWDLNLLEALKPFQKDIGEFYASFASSFCGSMRHPESVPQVDHAVAQEHIKAIHKLGASFSYVANSLCLGNKEYFQKKELFDFFLSIQSMGADCVVLSNPFLIDFSRKYFPDLKIKLSLVADVTSWQKLKFFIDKVDVVTIPDTINRDLKMLKRIVSTGKKVEILLNNLCLLDCPLAVYHGCVLGHSSQEEGPTTKRFDDFSIMWCTSEKMKDPIEFIKSPWIRPEDVEKYEDIGIHNFKISGREKKTEWIVQRVKIYADRCYDGNLLDFLNPIFYGYPKYSPEIYIDNKKLEGFIDFFLEGRCEGDCPSCSHCMTFSQEALSLRGDLEGYKQFLLEARNRVIEKNI